MRIVRLFKTTCLLFVLLTVCIRARAQYVEDTTVHHGKYLSIGARRSGICFGNSHTYSGFRFNLLDKKVKKINGFNMAFFSKTQRMNGFALGIVADNDSVGNGLAISTAFTGGEYRNGIAIGGLMCGQQRMNGLGIGGIYYAAGVLNGIELTFGWSWTKKLNGFAFGGVVASCDSVNGVCIGGDVVCGYKDTTAHGHDTSYGRLSGVAIALFRTAATKLNGLAITLCYNQIIQQHGVTIAVYNNSTELRGIQIGLINHAANNPRGLRWLPFINMHLRKSKVDSH